MTTRLDISIGPVQGFVASSRRTRDLWGSSYLLSCLAAHAMRGAQEAGGKITQPRVEADPLFRRVCGDAGIAPPQLGSLPNHFVVAVEDNPGRVAQAAREALSESWRRVCTAVWEAFVQDAEAQDTRKIWDRQVETFWEVAWTAGPPDVGGGLLARRKHWRTCRAHTEPGDKCTIMHDLQELSGEIRAKGRGSGERQDTFWSKVRSAAGPLDLREDERLCAIALVKRLFPRVSKKALGWEVETTHWPSTVAVAAVPWLRHVVAAAPEAARSYASAVRTAAPAAAFGAGHPALASLREGPNVELLRLDASYFHPGFVADERLCPLSPTSGPETRTNLLKALQGLIGTGGLDNAALGPPSSFYALLLADGDRLGRLVATIGGDAVGRGLATFTAKVPAVVAAHDGVVVYAGGDDVLVMLPVPQALSCAEALAVAYRKAFVETTDASLSASVVMAHVRVPMGAVLGEARRLLDEVAKTDNGRNSLAVGILKRGGLHCQWATTWHRTGSGGVATPAVAIVEAVSQELAQAGSDPRLSSGLLYRLRETLGMLCGWPRWIPGVWGSVPEGVDLAAFLHAEILRSLSPDPGAAEERSAARLADLVLGVLGRSRARVDGVKDQQHQAGVDGLLLARFLAGQEQDEGQS